MKKLINFIMVGVMIGSLSNCKKGFLEVKPQGAIQEGDLATPEGVEGLVLSAYAWIPHQATINDKLSPWLADIKSDDSYKGGGGLSDQTPWYQMEVFSLTTPSVGNNDGMWYGQYEGISRVNSALRALNAIGDDVYPLKTQRIAEMKYLRGYMFMNLKKWFRWIPYYDENVTADSIVTIPNHPDTAKSDLYLWQHIVDDLVAAANGLPATQTDVGRPTKYAAEGFAAQALMWMAYEEDDKNQVINVNKDRLAQAMTYLDEIINSDVYSLAADFSTNFEFADDNRSAESLWEWQYSHSDGTPNGNLNGSTPLNAPWWPPYFSCCDFHKASYTMVNAFRVGDNGLPMFDNYNDAEITDKEAYFADNKWDPRFGHTVAVPGMPWKYQQDLIFDSSGARDPANYGYFNSLKENVEAGSPGLVNLFWMWNSKNETAMRFDRVLLLKAEILIKLGRETEALPLINQVRTRAANSTDLLKFADGTPTLNYSIATYQDGVNCTWTPDFAWKALVWENRLEFAMEGERWYDLVRWGIAEPTLNAYFDKEKTRSRTWLKDGRFTAGRDEYAPIPQPQMNYSYGVYKQNVGY